MVVLEPWTACCRRPVELRGPDSGLEHAACRTGHECACHRPRLGLRPGQWPLGRQLIRIAPPSPSAGRALPPGLSHAPLTRGGRAGGVPTRIPPTQAAKCRRVPSANHKEEIPLSHRTATSAALRARPASRVRATAAAASLLALALGNAQAFEVDTGNADVSVRWDNTFRYNYANRVEGRDSKIGNSALSDEGDYSFDKGQTRVQPPGPAVRAGRGLQEALRLPPQRHRLVRRRLRQHQPQQPEPAAVQHPELRRQPVHPAGQAPVPQRRRADGRLRLRRRRHRQRAGERQGRPPHPVLGRVAVPGRPHAQHRLRPEPAGPAKGLRHARHRGQGTVPPAEPAVGPGAGERHPVAGRAVPAGMGAGPLSGRRHLPGPGGLRVQRPAPPVPLPGARLRRQRRRRRAQAERRIRPVGALESHRRWTARWASITGASPTSCRRPCSPRSAPTPAATTWSTPTRSTCSASAWPRTSAASASAAKSPPAATRR